MNEVLITALFSIGFNLFMFIPAFIYKTDKLTDISYALTFFTVAIFSYFRSGRDIVHTILLTAILLWSIRLGSFLYMRILRMKRDRRFDDKRDIIASTERTAIRLQHHVRAFARKAG